MACCQYCDLCSGHEQSILREECALIGDDGNEVMLLRGDADVHNLRLDVDPPPQVVEHVRIAAQERGAEVNMPGGVRGAPVGEPWRVGLAQEEDPAGEIVYAGGRMWHMDLDARGELEMLPRVLTFPEEVQTACERVARARGGVVQRTCGEELDVVLEAGVGVDDGAEEAVCAPEGEEDGAWEEGEDMDDELGGQAEQGAGGGRGGEDGRRDHGGGQRPIGVDVSESHSTDLSPISLFRASKISLCK